MRIDFLQTSWFIGRWVESRRLSSTMHATRPGKHTKSELENGHRKWIYPLKMVIFHSYVNIYQRVIYEELTPFFRCWVEQLVSFEHHSTCTNVFFSNNQTSIELRNPTCPLVILIQHSYGPMEHGPFRSKKNTCF